GTGRGGATPALAPPPASAVIRETGDRIVAVINGAGSEAEKSRAMQAIVDQRVDVDGIARFSLGRFWRLASAAQRGEYDGLFRQVLVLNVTAKIGAYKGVAFALGRATPREEGVMVATTVTRPGEAPAEVDWLVGEVGAAPRIIDVVAEGTSLRVTQRSDYASFITHHNDDIGALIAALRKQVGQTG
ncbi:MAG: ABC transporter substrate-binding protein, partial [Rhodospirillales bacterium]|nr:ABC transporter substrate-binding protein [Rhodospirillales bacterium]